MTSRIAILALCAIFLTASALTACGNKKLAAKEPEQKGAKEKPDKEKIEAQRKQLEKDKAKLEEKIKQLVKEETDTAEKIKALRKEHEALEKQIKALAEKKEPASDKKVAEKGADEEKIEALLKHIETLKDATFVRNDKEYDGKKAAEHIRSKWQAQKKQIKTATDFIEKAASVSSASGKPYMIRFKDGSEKKSGDYLKEVLKEMEK